MNDYKTRNLETVVTGVAVKYGPKAISTYWPQIKIALSMLLIRLGLIEKEVVFNMKYLNVANKWANRFGFNKSYKYIYSFPGGIRMHRAVGIPEYDNSEALTVMTFEKLGSGSAKKMD